MILKPDALIPALRKNLPAIIWLSGDDPLLMQESGDSVRQLAREQGFTEREVMHAARDFNWHDLLHSAGSLSLFAERRLIELRLSSAKLEKAHQEVLVAMAAKPSPDNLLLVFSPRLEKATMKTKWFGNIDKVAAVVQLWPITPRELPGWIRRRLQHYRMDIDNDALQLLAERVEGNLLAATQEIEKLHVLFGEARLDLRAIAQSVADSSRFNSFELADTCLLGRCDRALKILSHLQAEGEEHLRVANVLINDIRLLAQMRQQVDDGHNIHGVVKAAVRMFTRHSGYESALNRHSMADLEHMLGQARRIELSVKGSLDTKPWDEIQDLVIWLSGAKPPVAA